MLHARQSLVSLSWIALTIGGGAALGQDVPTVLLRAGDPLLAPSSTTAARLLGIAAGGVDSYAAMVEVAEANSPAPTVIWGSIDGQAGIVLQYPRQVLGSYQQARYEAGFGISSNGIVAFSTDIANRPYGVLEDRPGFLDSLWISPVAAAGDPVPVTLEGTPIEPLAGSPNGFWRSCSLAGITSGSEPYWVAGEAEESGGHTVSRGIYKGVGGELRRVLGSGDAVSLGVSYTVSADADFNCFRFSPGGSRLIAAVRLDGLSRFNDEHVIALDSASGGESATRLISEGDQVPGGAAGERIKGLHLVGLSDPVDCWLPEVWFAAVNTTEHSGQNSVLIRDGAVMMREGQEIDGLTLAGQPLAAQISAKGDIACIWPARAENAPARTAAFFNGRLLLAAGAQTASGEVVTFIAPMIAIGSTAADGRVSVFLNVHLNDAPAMVRVRPMGTPIHSCPSDFDRDGDSGTDLDIEAFFAALGGVGSGSTDINCDGDVGTDLDIEAFFVALGSGC